MAIDRVSHVNAVAARVRRRSAAVGSAMGTNSAHQWISSCVSREGAGFPGILVGEMDGA